MRRRLVCLFLSLCAFGVTRAEEGAKAFTFEFAPVVGLNLPFDLWGSPGTLNVVGLRSSYSLPTGALELSGLIHHKDPDRAYTGELAYRYEMQKSGFHAFFVAGFHFSQFNLTMDYDEDGTALSPTTDSGLHNGITIGGGLLLPTSESTMLRLGLRYYKNPQLWVLLELALGIRF